MNPLMATAERIERILHSELDRTHRLYKAEAANFRSVLRDIPSGIPHPNSDVRIMFRFSVKWRGSVPPIVSVPPLRGGDFQGIRVYRSDAFWGRARKATPRARHRLDEPTGLSLGMVASLQSQRPFRSAMSL